MSFMKDFNHLKIQLKDILSATNNFDPTNEIGRGGFGRVYKGELPSSDGQITVAFKQLDRRLGQGNTEFWKEIMMLSSYKHENVISLQHFCNEGDQMILVYEYASRGSLDRYLSDACTLTWIQRLKVCIGAARGLRFLHDPRGTQQRVFHCDIKSANILLDENWNAKVSDFGLSKLGPANQAHTYMVSNAVGTFGYCDPEFMEVGFLSKESDVYSFGVVLYEVLCGKLCFECCNRELTKILVPEWRRCYNERRLDEIILPGLREQMHPGSLETFSAIAYQCVMKVREERPTMAKVVEELESAALKQRVILSAIAHQCVKKAREEQPTMAKVVEELESAALGKWGKRTVARPNAGKEMADVVINCAGNLLAKVVEQPIFRTHCHLGYVLYYNNYIKSLEEQINKLEIRSRAITLDVDEASRNGDIVAPQVEEWFRTVNIVFEESRRFLEVEVQTNKPILKGWFPNIKRRYILSKKEDQEGCHNISR